MLILAAVLTLPSTPTDVGKLQPVQTVIVYKEDGSFVLQTDTDDVGRGENILAALDDLKETTPEHIYLDTAEFLLIGEGTEKAVETLRKRFDRSAELYGYIGSPDPEAVSAYLQVHGNGPRFSQWQVGEKLPILDCREDRIRYLKNS